MAVKVGADTGWIRTARSNPIRGFNEFYRSIIFEDGSTYDEMNSYVQDIMKPYVNLGGPTWTSIKQSHSKVWELLRGIDSSD